MTTHDGPMVAFLGATVSLAEAREFLPVPEPVAGHVKSLIVDSAGHPLFASHPHTPVNYAVPLATPLLDEAPEAEAFGDLRKLEWLSLILETVFVAVLVAAAWVVAWDIVAPLGRLVSATRRVGQGDLGVRVAIPQREDLTV